VKDSEKRKVEKTANLAENVIERARKQWEITAVDRMEELRVDLRRESLPVLASRCGGVVDDRGIVLPYWGRKVLVRWPEISAAHLDSSSIVNPFDTLLLLYYLHQSNGDPLADRWIGFRELPGGAFYHQAFQGYSGDRLANFFEHRPDALHRAAVALEGVRLTGINEFAYAFQPLPRIRMAAVLWLGDEEFPSRGSILFDAACSNYMVLDGLAILGSRLVGKLQKAADGR
jgi:hypothetical protein